MILIDATPLQSEHRLRGVGTYARHLLVNLEMLRPGAFQYLATARDRELLPPEITGAAITGFRPHQPAQVYWLYNEWFLRRWIWPMYPALFHAVDFNGMVRVRGIPTVATLYDLTTFKEGFHHPGASARLSDLRWGVYYYHKLPQADHIIAISESAKLDAIHLLGIPTERITAIPLGVDLQRFQPCPREGRYASEPPYLLFIGGRMSNKNLDRVLQAFIEVAPTMPDLHLYLGGTWRAEDDEWLSALCPYAEIRRRIWPLGFVSDADLPSLYSNALTFVFPSLEEGFGLPVLESMACGTPVITSNRGALLEVAGDAAVLVDPTDIGAITTAMVQLAGSQDLRRRIQIRGTLRVQQFRWQDVARATLSVYDRVIESR